MAMGRNYGISEANTFKYAGGIGTVTGSGGATIDTKSLDKEIDKGTPTKSLDKEIDKGTPTKSLDKEIDKGTPTKSLDKEIDKGTPTKSLDKEIDKGTPTKSLDNPSLSPHPFNLPVDKIIYDADGNVLGMAIKTKNGGVNVLFDEARVLELSKEQIKALKISNEEYIKSFRDYLTTGEVNPRSLGGQCWKCWTVLCGSLAHPPGCGWRECGWVSCGGVAPSILK